MIKQLKQDGCNVEQDSFVGSTPAGQIPMTNVIAKISGAKSDVIMIAGHYDTMRFANGNFVGANDAGSSTAFLLEMAERRDAQQTLDLPMQRTDIADYLGLTIETVCRTLTAFKRAGAIVIPNAHRIAFCDRHALAAACQA